ncbi:UNVERIFIED_CONTAM: putative protein K02A2.6 [Sesamum latifolium]|uniref:Reverse transcriptase/retrotransposon-derived protein RNase H-like domain-containing protein n=1 Tax=Sesamum latifolium TaxID=2727402 RepID=A0AAW2WGW7_9LAMI
MPRLDLKVAVHHLSVKKGARPVKQGQRRFRPELIPLIETEVNKLIEVGFIREVKYPMWISSIVLVRKKNGQIRVYVDLRDLNNACPKDDFLLPIAELMIDATTGHEALSFMDGSSGYNQICMAPANEELTAFRTPKAYDKAFKSIQSYLTKPPVLVAPVHGRPLILYVAAQERSVGILLAQKNDEGKENALYYLSRTMTPNELKYSPIGKLYLALIFAIQKLKHYFQSHSIHLVSKACKMLSDNLPYEDVLVVEITPPWRMASQGARADPVVGREESGESAEGSVAPASAGGVDIGREGVGVDAHIPPGGALAVGIPP